MDSICQLHIKYLIDFYRLSFLPNCLTRYYISAPLTPCTVPKYNSCVDWWIWKIIVGDPNTAKVFSQRKYNCSRCAMKGSWFRAIIPLICLFTSPIKNRNHSFPAGMFHNNVVAFFISVCLLLAAWTPSNAPNQMQSIIQLVPSDDDCFFCSFFHIRIEQKKNVKWF